MSTRWDITVRRGVDWAPEIRWRQEPDTSVSPVRHRGGWHADATYQPGEVVTYSGTEYVATSRLRSSVAPDSGGTWTSLAAVDDTGFAYSLKVWRHPGESTTLLSLTGTGDGTGTWSPSWLSDASEAADWRGGHYEILATSPGGVETVLATGRFTLLDHGASVGGSGSDGVVAVESTGVALAVTSRQGPEGIQGPEGPAGQDGALAVVAGRPITSSEGRNLASNTDVNSIAEDVSTSTIVGGGASAFPQRIGSVVGSGASYATIGGGYDNTNDMLAGTIAGGAHHVLDSSGSTAELSHDHGTICGGSWNTIAAGPYSVIGGGHQNAISGTGYTATIAGGRENAVSGPAGTVGGGQQNSTAGYYATVAGGLSNTADANARGAAIGGGEDNSITGADSGHSTISGGTLNRVRNDGSAPTCASIGGGKGNVANNYGTRVGGGVNNTASGNSAIVSGGLENTASGTRSTVVGGGYNTASGERSVVNGGESNTASGFHAGVPFGQENEAAGNYSSARGLRSKATINGQHAVAVGNFATAGDAQAFEVVLRKEVSVATNASMTVDGSALLVMPDDTAWVFDALVVGRCAATGEHAAYRLAGLIKRDTGAATTAMIGSVTTEVLAESNAAWNAGASADTNSGDLRFRVTGENGKTIRWVAHVRVASVGMP